MNCLACDKPIERGWAKWCGQACYRFSERYPGEKRPGPRPCEACGNEFQPKQVRARFCSSFCGEVASGARFIGPRGWVITCEVCEERRAVGAPQAKSCHVCRFEWERRRGERWRVANPERRRELERGRKRPNRTDYVRRWRRERWMDEHATGAAPAWAEAAVQVERTWLALPAGPPVEEKTGPCCPIACDASRSFTAGRCLECDAAFVVSAHRGDRYCSPICGKRYDRRQRRARQVASFVERVSPRKVYERDGWRCQLCKRLVSKTAVVPHPRAATIDHIIPLSKHGEHSMANAQTAHFICNSEKGARARNEQLRLVG